MKWLMALMLAATVTFGGTVVALEVGESVGPVWVNTGSVICDTVGEVTQAIDTTTPWPYGCGTLTSPQQAFVEAISEHEYRAMTFVILKLEFSPRSRLGIQYGWELHKDSGQPV